MGITTTPSGRVYPYPVAVMTPRTAGSTKCVRAATLSIARDRKWVDQAGCVSRIMSRSNALRW